MGTAGVGVLSAGAPGRLGTEAARRVGAPGAVATAPAAALPDLEAAGRAAAVAFGFGAVPPALAPAVALALRARTPPAPWWFYDPIASWAALGYIPGQAVALAAAPAGFVLAGIPASVLESFL